MNKLGLPGKELKATIITVSYKVKENIPEMNKDIHSLRNGSYKEESSGKFETEIYNI